MIQCRAEESWPLATSEEVIINIKTYFFGGDPSIGILLPAFSNGHIECCSENEKTKIYDALFEIKNTGIYNYGRHIDDFINILNVKEEKP